MPIVYQVTVSPTEKENLFHITWYNEQTKKKNSFKQSAAEITVEEIEQLWQKPRYQLGIGRKLYRFLDGSSRYLERALQEAVQQGESLILHLCTCKETSDWPFELLCQKNFFLLPQHLHLVRCISQWGKNKELPPRDHPLKLLFMACSAVDVKPELDFEKEEESIFQVTADLGLDMEVEDSGSLEGLRRKLEQEAYDVVHLSGHADIDKHGRPFFVMEDETGRHQDVLPGELWEEALIENPPRLLFLSGCRTGETPGTGAAVSFARVLVEDHQVPAVLGWGRSVSDQQATIAEKMIYKELSRGKSILEAVQRARHELIKNFPGSSFPTWPLLRLFSSGVPLNAIVTAGQKRRPQPRRMKHTYLKQSRVQVLEQGFVGRRRQLQASLRVLFYDHDKIGVLLHGTGGLGKSCLAGKICERFKEHHLIIVHGRFNAIPMEAALKDAFVNAQDETGEKVLAAEAEMTDKLAKLCAGSFKQKNYLILLDDFEQNLEGADRGQPGLLVPEAAQLLEVLLHYLPFSGKMTQLIITCRYLFSLNKKFLQGGPGGAVFSKSAPPGCRRQKLEPICLTTFQPAEQRKKVRELEHIFNYPGLEVVDRLVAAGRGNPRLMEWLDILVGEMPESEVPLLLEAVKDKQEDFIRDHVIRELLRCGGGELARFLGWFAIYRQPVLIDGVGEIGEKAGIKGWEELLQRGIELSLAEHDRAGESYGVTPLLREELLTGVDSLKDCHQAAFSYYKKRCELMGVVDAVLVEEWIYHALGCGEEDIASKQGGRLVDHLCDRLAFRESRRVGEWVLAGKNRELCTGDDAFLLNELAYTIDALGGHRKAIEYFEQALAIDEAVFGKEHPGVAIRLNNMGSAWDALGGHRKAIEYYEQALAILKEVYDEKHPQVAGTLNNLDLAWKALGKPRKAIEYYEQALAINEAVFGKEHPYVAVDLNNLGSAWDDLGDHRKAIKYFEQALAIDEKVSGKEHPDVAVDLNNLGETWRVMGEPRKAIEYYEQALAIWKKVYGEKHPQVATALNNLGAAYFDQGQKDKAKPYFERAYAIFKKFFGDEHPHMKTVKKRLEDCTKK